MSEFVNPLQAHECVDELTDERIDACFRSVGGVHKDAARALIGLVGEVERRGIHARDGVTSSEYATRYGGLSTNQIDVARRLDQRTRDLPRLRHLFQHGLVPLNRLRVVIGIATPERDAELASLVQRTSKAQLETWIREMRARERSGDVQAAGGAPAPADAAPPVFAPALAPPDAAPESASVAHPVCSGPPTPPGRVTIAISPVLNERLGHERARLAVKRGRAVSIDELLLHLLDGEDRSRSRYIPVIAVSPDGASRALRTAAGDLPASEADLAGLEAACLPIDLDVERDRLTVVLSERPPESRARPAAVDRYVQARSGGTCEFPPCHEPGHGVHHWTAYAERGTHHPDNLSVLCALHMDLADRGLIRRTSEVGMQVVWPSACGPAGGAAAGYGAARRRAVERKIRITREVASGRRRTGHGGGRPR
jgi:hypothetical protein